MSGGGDGVVVVGGVDGIAARADDLLATATLLRTTVTELADAHSDLTAPGLQWALVVGERIDPAGAAATRTGLASLAATLGSLGEEASTLVLALAGAAAAYRETEQQVGSSFVQRALDSALGAFSVVPPGRLSAGSIPFRVLAPTYTVPRVLAPVMLDGHPVLHDLGPDELASIPPRALSDLVVDLAHRDAGSPGEISVSFVTGSDGRRRAIVDLPGTKSWNPAPVHDVTSVGTDVLAITGRSTSYQRGVLAALADAGVGPGTEVMLVGHSEGGIVAVDAARAGAESGRFRITHVVTAGSPVGELASGLPATVRLLSLENTADIVPALDGVPNPDRPNVTTVRADVPHGSIGADHNLMDSYQPVAVGAQTAGSGSVEAFEHSARGFLTGTSMTTHAYLITRDP